MTIRDIAIAFGYKVDPKSEKKVNDSIDKIKSTATKVLGAIGIGFSLVKMNEVIEEFGKVNAQIKNATEGLGEQKDIQNQIITAANAARVAYGDIAGVVSKLVKQNADLFDVTSAAKYAELTTKLFKSENMSQGDILNLQEAINNSFAKGAVEANTVEQILEKSPAAADLLAKAVGASRTELSKMASDGKISLEQLRDAFLGNAENIEASFSNVNLTITDALVNIRNGWGLWLTQMDGTLGVTKTIAKIMTRAFNAIMNALRKVQTWTERVVKIFGSAERMLKMIAIAGGAIYVAMNAGKILSFLKSMGGLVSKASLKFLAIAAVIAIVALLIEDFINFMQGNDSLLGEMLKMAGIDADAVRQTIINAWQAVKDFLSKTWEFLKRIARTVWNGLKAFWTEHGENVKETLLAAWNAIVAVLTAAWNALKVAAFVIFSALQAFWETWGSTIINILGTVWKLIGENFDAALQVIKGLFNLFAAVFTGDWEGAWNAVKEIASGVWDSIVATFTAAKDIIVNVFDKLYEIFGPFAAVIAGITAAIVAYKAVTTAMAIVQGIMAAATSGLSIAQIAQAVASKAAAAAQWLLNAAMSANPIGIIIALIAGLVAAFVVLWNNSEAFRNFFIGMWEGIKSFFAAVVDWFKKAFAAIADFFKAVWEGIKSFFKAIWDFLVGIVKTYIAIWQAIFKAIGDAFKAIWEGIKTFFKAIWDFLVSIVKTYIAIWQAIFTAVGDFFKAIWNGIASFFKGIWDAISGMVSNAAEAAKSVFTAVGDFFKAIWEGIKKFFSAVWDFLVNIIKTYIAVWMTIFTAIGDFFKAIWNAIVAFFTSVWETITGIASAAGETVKAVFTAIGDFFTAVWNAILAFFQAIWDGMVSVVNNFFGIFTATFTAVSDFFTSIWSGISDFFMSIWDGIKSVFSTVTEFFGGAFTAAADAVKAAFSGIAEFFGNVFTSIGNIIKAPINGIIGGINKVLSSLNGIKIPDWVPGIGGKGLSFSMIPTLAKGGVLKKGQTGYLEGDGAEAVVPLEKNTGWIAKVAAQFKKNVSDSDGAGMVKGITEAVKGIGGVVGNAVKSVSDKVATAKENADKSGITDALRTFGENIVTLARSATANPGTVQSVVSSATNRSVTQNNYFESTFNGDRAGQKRSSEAMDKSTTDATGELARALAFAR